MLPIVDRPRVLQPGLMILAPGTERYVVHGGAATAIMLRSGDTIEIVDPTGGQQAEVSVFAADGTPDPGLLGLAGRRTATGIQAILGQNLVDARRVRAGLAARQINLATATAVAVFDNDTTPGTSMRATASANASCIVAAVGAPMQPHEQTPPTDLILYVHRATILTGPDALLPVPLADPSQDFRIDRATARAYEVKAGEYIQILDIEGRECSDFQCLDARALDNGIENALDATYTRTNMGALFPGPGLYSKFYGDNMQPMVEVIQDTVGRHDTFNTACSAKYYEEMGYPGHVNCTDNMNAEFVRFGIGARPAWEAINFFYNTQLDAANQIFFDEPWSRPGDYVLLRALTDLVAISTACPCDIDAANGWNPTDIQIRVYDESNMFKKATAFRMTADSEGELTKETGFHSRTSELARNFTEYNGYWLANTYRDHGEIAEYWACREAAAVIDLSPLRKYEVVGPDAEELMQICVTRNIRKLADGQVVYTAMCYKTGGMIDDGTVFRLGRENFRWVGGSDASGLWLRRQAEERGLRAWVRDSTDQLHNIQVQGPKSRDIMSEIYWSRPDQPTTDELGWFRMSIGRLHTHDGIPVVISRTGYTGEFGYEIFCHPSNAPAVWDAVFTAGKPYGVKPMGLAALNLLRIEAGLIFAGYEFCDQTDPYEAGIGFTVPLLTKEDDFIGRDALIRRKGSPNRKLVGLKLEGGELGANGDTVHVGRAQVGEITSGAMSPIMRKNVALCRMSVEYAEIGTEVEVGKIDGHQKRIPAQVIEFPFYDPTKSRVRGES